MPSRKQEKRRRKLRVHGPSADAVGAPPVRRKEPRAAAAPARAQRQRSGRAATVPSLKRSARKGALLSIFMFAIVIVTTRGDSALSIAFGLAETLSLVVVFVFFDLWLARKVYKRVTGEEAPR
jgi:hypothetical protein